RARSVAALLPCGGSCGKPVDQSRELRDTRSEQIVKRSDRDHRLALDAQRLRRRSEPLLQELVESFLSVPELDDPVTEAHRRREVQIDPRGGSPLHPPAIDP